VTAVRRPAVAGLFYPRDPGKLAATVDGLLAEARPQPAADLRALVAPHAGYEYSGPVAASAFALAPRTTRVLLLGPSHYVPVDGLAVSGADAWATPLGEVPVAPDLREAAVALGAVVNDAPHAGDHALEVELPFLQRACPDGLEILPVAVGRTHPEEVAALVEALAALVVVSTDLSHFLADETAKRVDRGTADAVVRREPDAIRDDAACGVYALRGLVEHARRHELEVELIDLRTSADSGGDTAHVVGYCAIAVRDAAPDRALDSLRRSETIGLNHH
jgi:AmmeMemoRadiSam system protein B